MHIFNIQKPTNPTEEDINRCCVITNKEALSGQ